MGEQQADYQHGRQARKKVGPRSGRGGQSATLVRAYVVAPEEALRPRRFDGLALCRLRGEEVADALLVGICGKVVLPQPIVGAYLSGNVEVEPCAVGLARLRVQHSQVVPGGRERGVEPDRL